MDALFGILGLAGIVVGAAMLLFNIVTKKPKKLALIVVGVSLVAILVTTYSNKSEIKLSQESFAEGIFHFENSEYRKAIRAFEKVIEEDVDNYQKAQEYIKETELLLSQDLLDGAKRLFEEGQYIEAKRLAESALALNPDIGDEANPLIEEATQKYELVQSERKRKESERKSKEIVRRMKTWEGTGSARVSVSEVIAMSSFYDGYRTWRPKDPENYWYLLVDVAVLNASQSTLHVNPNFVTLICNSRVFNPDTNTYALDNYLDAIDLQPDTYTSGWLLFLVPKSETHTLRHTLVHQGIPDNVVKKEIVVTETR